MRILGLAKGGYYKCPPEALRRLTQMFVRADDDGVIRVLDPCAGEGEALQAVCTRLNGTAFAVELQRDRANTCRSLFENVVWGDAFRMRMTGGSMSMVVLNPPYDNGAASGNAYEAKFLKELDRALTVGGVLVYLVPIDRLAAAASWVAGHYDNVHVWKFPQAEYEVYEQVALVGSRRRNYRRNDQGMEFLEAIAGGRISLAELPESGEITIPVPTVWPGQVTFESAEIDEDALIEALHGKFSAWNHGGLRERLWPSGAYHARPLMPLTRGHLAQLLAAGYLDNRIVNTDQGKLLVKGQIRKQRDEIENDPDNGRRRERERLLVSVNVFNTDTQKFRSYQEHELGEFVTQYRDALTNAVIEGFPAQYGIQHRQIMPLSGLLRTPIGGQADAIRGLSWGFKFHKGLIGDGEMGTGKTYIGAAVVRIAGVLLEQRLVRNFVMCPPHLVEKWAREIKQTIPGAITVIIKTPTGKRFCAGCGGAHIIEAKKRRRLGAKCADCGGDIVSSTLTGKLAPRPLAQVDRAMRIRATPNRPVFIICSREQVKLSYRTRHAAVDVRPLSPDGIRRKGIPELSCPSCFRMLVDKEGNPLTVSDLEDRRVKCLCQVCRESGGRVKECQNCCGTVVATADVVSKPPLPGQPRFVDRGDGTSEHHGRYVELMSKLGHSSYGSMRVDRLNCYPPDYGRRENQADLRRFEIARYIAKQYGMGKRVCPECGSFNEAPTPARERRRHTCADCGSKTIRSRIDLFICDEVHEMKAESTAQGRAAGVLAAVARKSLALSGSIYSGMASDLFYLLYRFSPEFREQFRYDDVVRFVEAFGIYEYVYTRVDAGLDGDKDLTSEVGAVSKRGSERCRRRERPGMSPAVLLHVIGIAVFLRLEDVAEALPPYKEEVHVITPDDDLLEAYKELDKQLADAQASAPFGQRMRIAGAALQIRLSYPSTCTQPVEKELKVGKQEDWVRVTAPALSPTKLYALERKLFEDIRESRDHGRRTLVFYTNTGVRDLGPRLLWLAEQFDLKAAVLKASVKPEAREGWIEHRVREGVDVIFSNPRLVETGLDLLDFPEISWAQIYYSTVTVRQASRRSWRIPQKLPVRVRHYVYDQTEQIKALLHIATKVHTSNQFDGDLIGDGLDELAGDDAVGMLAKQLYEGAVAKDSLEALFANIEEVKADQDTYLDSSFHSEEGVVLTDTQHPRLAATAVAPISTDDPASGWTVNGLLQLAFVPSPASDGESLLSVLERHDAILAEQRVRQTARSQKKREATLASGQLTLF